MTENRNTGPVPAEGWTSGPFRALRSRNYRLFFSGQAVSLIGTWMQRVAMSWLVYRITLSPFALGVVDFSIFPHLDHPDLPENTMADAEKWAAGMSVPCYAIDDETAIKVVDGTAEVVSEGHWKLFAR